MKTFIKDIKSWITIWIFFLITISIGWFIVYATWWNTTSPTTITNDASLFTDAWNNLTSNKWNEVVNKVNSSKGLDNAKILTCIYNQANAWVVWWKIQTWTTANCGWVSIPSDFTNIIPSLSRVDWTWIQNWTANCTPTTWMIFLDTANLEAIVECSYLVWN